MNAEVKGNIRSFLEGRLALKGDGEDFSDSESIFTSGRLDSLDAMETVIFLEDTFGIDFGQVGFELAIIDSPDAIAALATQYGTAT